MEKYSDLDHLVTPLPHAWPPGEAGRRGHGTGRLGPLDKLQTLIGEAAP